MRIAITADIHVGVPGRLDDIMWSLRRIRHHSLEHGAKHILILGDLLHDREQIGVDSLNALVDFLIESDEKYGIEFITFPGNHDMYLKNSWDINSIKPLTRYLKSYHKVTSIKLGGIRFWIVPFIHYESEYMKVIDAVNKKHNEGDVLLTHIGVKSATLNTCFLLKSWSIVDFNDSPFDRIYTGHFHVHQQVGHNMWYPGSPIPFRFDEGDVEHGFFIFDTESREHEFIDLWKNAENPPPRFTTISDSNLKKIKTSQVRGNIVRIALNRDYTHNQLSAIRKVLHKLGAKDVRWLNMASKEDKEGMGAAIEAASSDDLFERFIEADKAGVKGLNKSLLLKFNKEIVAEGDKIFTEEQYA